MTWQLTARTGAKRGESWNIGTQPLTLGRSLSCDITIGDPTVSRKHCEIMLDQDVVHFRDLGSRNVSLVNGQVVLDCKLDVGDELTLGAESFIISRVSTPAAPQPAPESEARLTTLSLGEAYYVRDSVRPAHPASVQDMLRLYHFGGKLRKAHTEEEYATLCLQELEELFPARVSTAVCCTSSDSMTWYPPTFPATQAVRDHVRDVVDTGSAAIRTVREKHRLLKRLVIIGAAPLVLTGRCRGAMVAVSDARGFVLDESELSRLDALAQTASPYLAALEHRDALPASDPVNGPRHSPDFLGESPSVEKLRGELEVAARTGLNVLITGEPGTGKELAACIIHEHSDAPLGAMVSTNCVVIAGAGFLRALVGSELVAPDHRVQLAPGLLDQSNGGTMLLRELDALSDANQTDLARLLERGAYTRVGGHEEIAFHGRVIATTSKDLDQRVQEGTFRQDLLHLLDRQRIDIKPLRRRPADIEALARHFVQAGRDQGDHQLKGLTSEALDFLRELPLAGNTIELRDTLTRAVRYSQNEYLSTKDLTRALPDAKKTSGALDPLASAERTLINAVLAQCNQSLPEAAAILGIPEESLSQFLSNQNGAEPSSV